jgi:hypothetical protein
MTQPPHDRPASFETGTSPYGRHPRSVLDGYVPIPYDRHVRDYRRAAQGRGRWPDEYLVEDHGDGTVTLFPSNAWPLPGRVIWRRVPDSRRKT